MDIRPALPEDAAAIASIILPVLDALAMFRVP